MEKLISAKQMCRARLGNSRSLVTLLKLSLLVAVISANIAAVCATMSPEMAANGDGENANFVNGVANLAPNDVSDGGASAQIDYDIKRSWQSLQGPWGKRAQLNGAWNGQRADADDEIYMAEHWVPVLVGNGERVDPKLKYRMVYLTNAAALERLAHQRQETDDPTEVKINDETLMSLEDTDIDADGILNEKRTWKNMNVAWGKRRNAPAWNKFRGAWGKREPGWNNLKGMWGKRASEDWQKLHAGWGKRSQHLADFN